MRAAWALAVLLAAGVSAAAEPAERPKADAREAERARMVTEQIEARGVRDPRVLAAMRKVPRHEFVPPERRADAYTDGALPIHHGSQISQPFVVATMTELAALGPDSRVLEVGTGSGYQAAILAELAREVYTIEIVEPLAREAEATLARSGYERVHVRAGDGYRGWPEAAPFDAIVITAAAPRVPPALVEQLEPGGRLVMPEGESGKTQELMVYTRTEEGVEPQRIFSVRFVPMTGEIQRRAPADAR
jgi:protein-L-isoaspartate(D-aspartate) O-methyltransferase